MLIYTLRRLVLTIPVLLGASAIVFFLIYLVPGSPEAVLGGPDASAEDLAAIRERLQLDRPVYVQYVSYLGNVIQGDLGQSYYYKRSVTSLMVDALPATFELAVVAFCLSLVIAIPLGVFAAVKRNSWLDHISMTISVIGVSIPVFWLAIMLIYLFAVKLNWLPASGRGGPLWTWDGLSHILLPAISLSAMTMASVSRLTRSSMLEILHDDYIRTARAKGLGERAVLLSHALRSALIPVITIIGLQIAGLLSGSFITEIVFAWPGIGRLSVDAMFRRDYPLVQGTLLLVVVIFILVNLLVDILYSLIDPRIRLR